MLLCMFTKNLVLWKNFAKAVGVKCWFFRFGRDRARSRLIAREWRAIAPEACCKSWKKLIRGDYNDQWNFFFARIINHVVANIQQKFHVLGMICSSCKHETVLSQDLHNRARSRAIVWNFIQFLTIGKKLCLTDAVRTNENFSC